MGKPPIEVAREMIEGLEGVPNEEWKDICGTHLAINPEVQTIEGKLVAVVGEVIDNDVHDYWDLQAIHIARCDPPNISALATSYLELVEAIEAANNKLIAVMGYVETMRENDPDLNKEEAAAYFVASFNDEDWIDIDKNTKILNTAKGQAT